MQWQNIQKRLRPKLLNSQIIKELAKKLGFDACGICRAEELTSQYEYFSNWIKLGYNAEMNFLENHTEIRKNPQLIFPKTKSIVTVLFSYNSQEELADKSFSISKYAYGKDYHKVVKEKLQELLMKIQELSPEIKGRAFVDTAPILERTCAVNSGLGFIGKNKCLINSDLGSFVFIGELFIDFELEYDTAISGSCGSCTKCLDACPTGALTTNGLDARKCISYHTIESKTEIPSNIKEKISSQAFGCDICQDVCPYNQKVMPHSHSELKILPQIKNLSLGNLENMSETDFNVLFSESALMRAGKAKLIWNFESLKFLK